MSKPKEQLRGKSKENFNSIKACYMSPKSSLKKFLRYPTEMSENKQKKENWGKRLTESKEGGKRLTESKENWGKRLTESKES